MIINICLVFFMIYVCVPPEKTVSAQIYNMVVAFSVGYLLRDSVVKKPKESS